MDTELKLNFRKLIAPKDEVIHAWRKKKYESLVDGNMQKHYDERHDQ